jgi:hypothetical protein
MKKAVQVEKMLKNKLINNKKGQTVQIVIMLVVGLVVVGILIYLGYRYILGTGRSVGELGTCQGQGGRCESSMTNCDSKTEDFFRGMGCSDDKPWCCMPKSRTSG